MTALFATEEVLRVDIEGEDDKTVDNTWIYLIMLMFKISHVAFTTITYTSNTKTKKNKT